MLKQSSFKVRLDAEPLASRIASSMQGKLTFETDYDFSILYKGELYTDYDFSIYIFSMEDFDEITFLGPWGSGPTSGKFSEVQEMLQEIRANPSEPRCFLGGNRGVEWEPQVTEADDIIRKAKQIAQELKMLPRETVLEIFAQVLGVLAGEGETPRN